MIENPPEEVERLVNENIRLAHFFANKWSVGGWIDPDDALSRALAALLRAAQQFDQSKGAFGSFVAWKMKSQIGRYLVDLRTAKRGGGTAVHVAIDDSPGEHSHTYAETIADTNEIGAFAILAAKDDSETCKIQEWVAALDTRSARIITGRFGLDGKEPMTLAELGEELGLTHERIRQIEAKAMKKLWFAAKNKQP